MLQCKNAQCRALRKLLHLSRLRGRSDRIDRCDPGGGILSTRSVRIAAAPPPRPSPASGRGSSLPPPLQPNAISKLTTAPSRRARGGRVRFTVPSQAEGAGKAGRQMHPQPRMRKWKAYE